MSRSLSDQILKAAEFDGMAADLKERLTHLKMRVQILEDEKSGGR